MSQKFNDEWNKIFSSQKAEKTNQDQQVVSQIEYFEKEHDGYILIFKERDGNQTALFYSNLIFIEYLSTQAKLLLKFTSHNIEIEGQKMEGLFTEILNKRVKTIFQIDERYSSIIDPKTPACFKLKIEKTLD